MSKAMRGYGCVMKRQKKKRNGGAIRSMPENLKEYLPEWEYPKEDKETKRKGGLVRQVKKMQKKEEINNAKIF
jgi:hypothetical protein